jgi:hypothetical protein
MRALPVVSIAGMKIKTNLIEKVTSLLLGKECRDLNPGVLVVLA